MKSSRSFQFGLHRDGADVLGGFPFPGRGKFLKHGIKCKSQLAYFVLAVDVYPEGVVLRLTDPAGKFLELPKRANDLPIGQYSENKTETGNQGNEGQAAAELAKEVGQPHLQ